MQLFRGKTQQTGARSGLLEDLERLARRVRAVPLAALALMLVGWGVGDFSKSYLQLPDGTPARTPSRHTVPRVHLEGLSRHLAQLRSAGDNTVEYVALYQEHVAPVEKVLRRRGVGRETARRIAWPLVEHSYERGLDPAFVVSVMLAESGGKPTATSPVGARGLMQVMPSWSGRWRGCGRNLYDIEANLCNGTSILAWYLRRSRDERKAILGYNGCVRGSNTPSCFSYPDKIIRLRQQVRRELNAARPPMATP
jgi:soluble lytic murein transglycosylase-like protein